MYIPLTFSASTSASLDFGEEEEMEDVFLVTGEEDGEASGDEEVLRLHFSSHTGYFFTTRLIFPSSLHRTMPLYILFYDFNWSKL